MPKGKRKNKAGGPNRHKPDSNYPSEEESIADNSSVSNLSDFRIDSDEDTLIEADEDVVVDDFGDKLKEAIEGTYQKSLKVRIASLEFIKKSLCSKYISDFILDRQVTLCDVAERSLRRGRGEEQVLGAVLAALLCTQLGSQDEGEAVFRALGPVLALVLADTTALPTVRQQCATSLGLCCFITCTGAEDIESTMESLYSVFSGSLFKGNGIPPIVKPEISALHSSALMGWNLLLTVLSPPYIMSLCNTHLRKLPQLLDSSDVDLRIAAGETLAMLYELARQCRNDFEGHDIDTLCEKLRQLATDCQKFRAKKDRRQQRSSFRDILQTIESQEGLDIKVRMGDDEILYIEDWCHKRQYDAFCHVLGSGMSLHLKQNDLLRDIFDLGEPIIDDLKPSPKNSKLQRHSAHLAACKARTKNLSKLRDKRADIMS